MDLAGIILRCCLKNMKHNFLYIPFKIILIISLVIISDRAYSQTTANTSQTAKLIVKFYGMSSNKGVVKIALCNSEQNYKNHKTPFIGKSIPIKNNLAEIEFSELPYGEYAVKAFHDEDGNDDLNTNLLGIPTEDYGFSNNARGMFGSPNWNDAKFKLETPIKSIQIEIK